MLVSPSTWQVRVESVSGATLLNDDISVGFSGMILWWVRILNEFEVAGGLFSARLTHSRRLHVGHREQVSSTLEHAQPCRDTSQPGAH